MSGGIGDTGDNIDLLVETRVNQSLGDVLADAETGVVDGDVVDDAVWAGDVDVPEESQGERGAYSKMQGARVLAIFLWVSMWTLSSVSMKMVSPFRTSPRDGLGGGTHTLYLHVESLEGSALTGAAVGGHNAVGVDVLAVDEGARHEGQRRGHTGCRRGL